MLCGRTAAEGRPLSPAPPSGDICPQTKAQEDPTWGIQEELVFLMQGHTMPRLAWAGLVSLRVGESPVQVGLASRLGTRQPGRVRWGA